MNPDFTPEQSRTENHPYPIPDAEKSHDLKTLDVALHKGPGQSMWPEKAARLKEDAPVLDKKFELLQQFGKLPGLLIAEGGLAQFMQPTGIIVNYVEGSEPSPAVKQQITDAAKPYPVIFGMRPKAVVEAYTSSLGEEVREDPFKDRLGADAIILERHDKLWQRCCGSGYVHGGGYHPHHDRTPELFLFATKGVEIPAEFKQELQKIAHPYKLTFEERGIMRVGFGDQAPAQAEERLEAGLPQRPIEIVREAPPSEDRPQPSKRFSEEKPVERKSLWQKFVSWLNGD